MATPAAPGGETVSYETPISEGEGTVIGPYTLREQIGEGGMGLVFVAEQTHPVRRKVALTVIKPGMDRGQVVARFEAERQALALMDHPNIAKVFDAGTTDAGRPYFVMELVKGVPLTEFCDAHKLSVPDGLDLFRQICSAVHHAHQKGVIHRDLKPSNILVESHDGKPVPKVIDFGLAKATTGLQLTEHTLFTAFGTVAGTPLYMAPEQATFNAIDVDSRADIYALGVILCELLAGSTPIHKDTFKTAALDEMLRVIREQEPPPPSSRIGTSAAATPNVAAVRQSEPAKLGRFVKGELDWIVMKALSKERERRYESATALTADVGRFLAHEPVTAGPPSQWYRLRKFVRRNKGRVVVAAAAAVLLVAGVIGTSLGMVAANRATARAVAEEGKAVAERDEKVKALDAETVAKNQLATSTRAEQQAAYDVTVPLIQKAIQENDFARASALLASCPEELRHWEWQFLNRQFDRGAVTLRPGYSQLGFFREVDEFTADGKLLVCCTGAKVRVRDAATGDTKHKWDFSTLGNVARLSPDRRFVAGWFQHKLAGFPQVEAPDAPDGPDAAGKPFDVIVVSLETGKPVARLTGLPDRVRAVLFGPDSSRLATACANNEVRVWDAAGKLLHTLKTAGAHQSVPVAFTPDGKSLVTNGVSGEAGATLAATGTFKGGEGAFRVWNLDTGTSGATGAIAPYADWTNFFAKKTQILPRDVEPFARFSPGGRYAVGLASDVFKFAVDLTTGKEAFRLPDGFTGLGFLPNSALLAANPDGVCTAFEVPGGRAERSYPLPKLHKKTEYEFESPIRWATQLSADGRWLILSDTLDGVVDVREAESGRVVRSVFTGRARSTARAPHTALDPTGTKLLTTALNGEQKLWDLNTDTSARTINLASESRSIPRVLAASPDGRTVAVLVDTQRQKGEGWPARLELADLRTGTSRVLKEGLAINTSGNAHAVFSPDGRKVLAMIEGTHTGLSQFHPHVWEVETGRLLVRSSVIGVSVNARSFDLGLPQIAFSPDGVPLVARTATNKDGPGQEAWLISEVVAERTTAPPRVTIMTGGGPPGRFFSSPGAR